jgi:hypothetical protein
MRSSRGQILPLALFGTLAMALLWIMILNAGKLIKDRIGMQIAADAAAQSACAVRARGLNAIGRMNSWLGTPVLGIGWPQSAWWVSPLHTLDKRTVSSKIKEVQDDLKKLRKLMKEGSQRQRLDPVLMLLLKGGMAIFATVYDVHPTLPLVMAKAQQNFITLIRDLQEAYNQAYGGGYAAALVLQIARRHGAEVIYSPKGSYSLRLQRNHGPVWYLSTMHVWVKGKPLAPVPFFPSDEFMEEDPKTRRWYEQGPDFHKKAMKVVAYRGSASSANGPFPLGRRLLGIQAPEFYAVAAARVYNPRGPMFPRAEQTRGFFGGTAAQRVYARAAERWQSQLVPVGGFYEH